MAIETDEFKETAVYEPTPSELSSIDAMMEGEGWQAFFRVAMARKSGIIRDLLMSRDDQRFQQGVYAGFMMAMDLPARLKGYKPLKAVAAGGTSDRNWKAEF